jgi:ankyrin repeat protein
MGSFDIHALIAAIRQQQPEIARILLSQGIDPNACDAAGRSPLSWAAAGSNVYFLDLLHEHGADLSLADRQGLTPLMQAVLHYSPSAFDWLLQRGVPLGPLDLQGRSALHLAALRGYYQMVQQLIAAGADLELADSAGETALMKSALQGHVSATQVLLQAGADPGRANAGGRSLLEMPELPPRIRQLILASDPALRLAKRLGLPETLLSAMPQQAARARQLLQENLQSLLNRISALPPFEDAEQKGRSLLASLASRLAQPPEASPKAPDPPPVAIEELTQAFYDALQAQRPDFAWLFLRLGARPDPQHEALQPLQAPDPEQASSDPKPAGHAETL